MRALTPLILATVVTACLVAASLTFASEITQVNRIELTEDQYATPTATGWYLFDRKELSVYSVDLTREFNRSIKGNERVVVSDRGAYFALLRYNDKSPTDIALLNVDVYNRTGTHLWGVANPRAVTIELNDVNGEAVGIAGAEGFAKSALDFYSLSGKYTGSIQTTYLSGKKWSSRDRTVYINSADSGLRSYDTTGSVVLDYGPAKRFALSEDGELLAVSSPGEIRYYRNGFKIGTARTNNENGNAAAAIAINKSTSVMAVMRRNCLTVHRLPTLDSVWADHCGSSGRSLSSVAISPSGLIAVGFDVPAKENGNTYHTAGGARLFDVTGSLLWSLDLIYTDWSREHPIVRFSSDGRYLLIATKDEAMSILIGGDTSQP
jgi:hypothetical protein